MHELLFVTNNNHKIEEISKLLDNKIKLLSLRDIGCFDEIPENQDTLEGNALQKARYVYDKYRCDCFADDTGLEVEALNGRPGVYSARYSANDVQVNSTEERYEANINKLLFEMKRVENRKAFFRTIICLIKEGKNIFFEGKVEGIILSQKRGNMGFGYDPIFQPDGYNKTFAEMSLDEKNQVSHRSMAIEKLTEYINNKI